MSDGKDLLVRIDATTTGYERSIARAEAQTHSFEYALRRANAEAAEQERKLLAQTRATEQLGRGMLVAGGVIAAGLALAAKAAIDWESQWTSVLKVLDGTPEQLAAVEDGIRGLSLEMPTSHEELAQIAASAGALGIQTPNIVEFTKTIAMLGETTNLVGDEGATTLARFANIMGTSQSNIDNVASALVALGNDGASTEAEIANLGLRLAAAGNTAGLTEGQVLGLANAMLSLGIPVEQGGTAMSITFQMIDKAVKGGGDSLEQFANVAGVSAAKFSQVYGKDAAGALTLFLDGLGRIKESGGNVYQILSDLGISGSRQVATLTAMAGANDQVTASLKTGVAEYERNMALTDEYAKRLETTAAQLGLARNAAVDFAIDLGETLLPAIGAVARDLAGFFKFLGDLPGPVKEIGVIMAAAAAAILLVGGSIIYTRVKMMEMRNTMTILSEAGKGMSRNMMLARGGAAALGATLGVLAVQSGGVSKELQQTLSVASSAAIGFSVGGPWGAAIGSGISLLAGFAQANADAAEYVQALTASLDEQTGVATQQTIDLINKELQELGAYDLAESLGIDNNQVLDAALQDAKALKEIQDQIANGDPSGFDLDMSNEQIDNAGTLLGILTEQDGALDSSIQHWRQETDAKEDSKVASDTATDGFEELSPAVEAVTAAVEELRGTLSKQEAFDNYEAAIDSARKALQENGKTLDNNTEAGRANRDMLRGLVDSTLSA